MTTTDLAAVSDYLARLDALLLRDVRTALELGAWEREAIEMWLVIRDFPLATAEIPESLWHFLSDADVRFKESVPVSQLDPQLAQDLYLLRHRVRAALAKQSD